MFYILIEHFLFFLAPSPSPQPLEVPAESSNLRISPAPLTAAPTASVSEPPSQQISSSSSTVPSSAPSPSPSSSSSSNKLYGKDAFNRLVASIRASDKCKQQLQQRVSEMRLKGAILMVSKKEQKISSSFQSNCKMCPIKKGGNGNFF